MVNECSSFGVVALLLPLLGALVVAVVLLGVVKEDDLGRRREGGPLLPGVPDVTSGICRGLVMNESSVWELTIFAGLSSFSGILLARMASKKSLNLSEGVAGSLSLAGIDLLADLTGEFCLQLSSTKEFLFKVVGLCWVCAVLVSLMGLRTSSGIFC